MSRRILQTAFGLAIGIAARLLLPGHYSIGLFAAAVLSLAGALAGEFLAEKLLPADTIRTAGFVVSALGAIAVLLVYGIAA